MIFLLLTIMMLIYAITIMQLVYGFNKIKNYTPNVEMPQTFFTIVVPFRNEAINLPTLLESFKNLDYPVELFEIILVDDFSDDHSSRLIYDWRMANGEFQATLLENIKITGSPKKDAIARAIPIVKNDWVITTDADCEVNPNWLLTLDSYIRNHNVSMVAGAVSYRNNKTFLHHFQQLDLTALQGATIGSFGLGLGFMCNGANFCYKKSVFTALEGFTGNNNTASGDDVFLLQKAVAAFPEKVHYLKSSANIVLTQPVDNWKALFQQRIRWASKTKSYKSVFGKDLAVIVFAGNLALVLGIGCWVLGEKYFGFGLLILYLIKFTVDAILLFKTSSFLGKHSLWHIVFSSLLYPFFSVAVALFSIGGKYEWKGRTY